jgi:hypothetical protein
LAGARLFLTKAALLRVWNARFAHFAGHKALIFGENVLYIANITKFAAARLQMGAYFFAAFPRRLSEGVEPTRQQWQENRVIV